MYRGESRRCARTGRQQSWVRYGECAGHHRGRRAGHVFRGVARDRGRASCLLVSYPAWGPGDQKPWRGRGASTLPRALEGHHAPRKQARYRGGERQAKRPKTGSVAVVAAQSTGEGGEVRPQRPTGGKAPSGRAFNGPTHERDFALTNRVTRPPLDCTKGQQRFCLRNRMRAWRPSGSVGAATRGRTSDCYDSGQRT
jgi:hypothetical protein